MNRKLSGLFQILILLPGAVALLGLAPAPSYALDYPGTILADHPLAYYRLEETNSSTAIDSSATGAFPGTYATSGAFPVQGWPGIDTKSIVLAASQAPDYVTAGYYPELNQPGPFSFEIWARPLSVPTGGAYRCPIGNSPAFGTTTQSGWYVYQTPDVPSEFALVTPTGDVFISTTAYSVGNWYHLAGTYDGTNMSFYLNGTLVGTQRANLYVANSVNNPGACVLGLGQRGDGYGNFDGELDEAAFYTTALSSAQILAHFQAGTNSFATNQEAPIILTQPASVNANPGQTVSFSVLADGASPLLYKWFNGSSAIPGATNATYSFTAQLTNDGSSYTVVVSNSFGSITSSVANLGVTASLNIDAQPTSIVREVGSSAAFEVVADGAPPLSYQWKTSDGTAIPGATNTVYWINNVQLTNDGVSYYVTITNPFTSVDSQFVTLNVNPRAVTKPVTGYAKIVLADGPTAYWRLDETTGSTNAVDSVGSFDGAYTLSGTNSVFVFGAPTGIPHETNSALGISGGAIVTIPYAIEINPTGAFSYDGWFNTASVPANGNDYRIPFSSISNPYGQGPTGWLVYQTGGNNWAWWPYNGNYAGIQITDNDQVIPNQWYHLGLVYDGTNFTFYVNGVNKGTATDAGFVQNGNVPAGFAANYSYNYDVTPGLPAFANGYGSAPLVLGWRSDSGFNPFGGIIDDVAVYNKALTAQQIQNHFANSVRISSTTSGGKLVVTWPLGTLQVSTNLLSGYTNVVGATSPFTNTISGGQRYFRVKL